MQQPAPAKPEAKPEKEWDKEPIDLELEDLAKSIDLQFEDPAAHTEEISEIRRIAMQTVESLRDIVWFLDPASDNMNELLLRMKETARTMLPGIPFEFRSVPEHTAARPSLELRRNLEWVERDTIRHALDRAGGVRKDAAALMGISQRALSHYLRKHAID